jgi:hypothetical protein
MPVPVPPPSVIFISPDGTIFVRTDVPYIYTDSLGNEFYEPGFPFNQNPPFSSFIIPAYNPSNPIPNPPFNNPTANYYNLTSGVGQLIFGDNWFVDYTTGTISVQPLAPNNGTVFQVTSGDGLVTSPLGGILTTGSISLAPQSSAVAGSYSFPLISVNGYGQIYFALNALPVLQTLTATLPIQVSGSNSTRNVGIRQASVSATGAVQLIDSLYSTDNTKALSAQQGGNLGYQVGVLGSFAGGQIFGGQISATTGNVTLVTPGGSSFPGIVVGSQLPTASSVYDGLFFIIENTGTYTPPGGSPTSVVKDDKVICLDGTWVVILSGTRLASSSTGAAGLTTLATGAEVQALTEPNKSVTAGSLSGMIASTTQTGFIELATNLETQALTDSTRTVTASNLNTLSATTATRGIVRLVDSTSDPSITSAPTSNALTQLANDGIDNADIIAKGDLIVGLNYQDPIILPTGANNSQLTVDDSKLAQGGLDWSVPDSLTSYPVGSIIWYMSAATPPSVWLVCDGRLLDASIGGLYYDLFSIIGTTFNTGGEPAGSFRVPDLRGYFVRGWSGSGTNPVPTALDPGRLFATTQTDAYKQHFHNVTDPGHCMPMPLPQHNHPSNSATVQHTHGSNGGTHSHVLGTLPVSEVVGDTGSFYDGNAGAGFGRGINGAFTGVSASASCTLISLAAASTGITVNTVTTGLTVNNAPPTAATPDESRPYNVALAPIIKFTTVG